MQTAAIRSLLATGVAAITLLGNCTTTVPLLSIQPAAAQSASESASEYRQRGLSYREQERYPEAIAALQKAVELEPNNLSGRVLLGWTLHRAGQAKEAVETLQHSLELNPFDVPTLNALGIVYLVGGQVTDAVITHVWAAILKSNNEIAYYNLSLAFERSQQYDWAISTANVAARLEPSNPHPLVALAIAHWATGDRVLAQQAYQQAIDLDPRYRDAAFLNYLNEAGFSADQIERSKTVLAASQ